MKRPPIRLVPQMMFWAHARFDPPIVDEPETPVTSHHAPGFAAVFTAPASSDAPTALICPAPWSSTLAGRGAPVTSISVDLVCAVATLTAVYSRIAFAAFGVSGFRP